MSEGHAFISYARVDADEVDKMELALTAAGIPVWRDSAELWPGDNWRWKIKQAIAEDALVFIACFSSRGLARAVSYQNEELALAIEQMRLRQPDVPWLIPVRFDDCQIPDREISGGLTLRSLHWADLFGDQIARDSARLVEAVLRILNHDHPEPVEDAVQAAAETSADARAGNAVGTGSTDLDVPANVMGAVIAVADMIAAPRAVPAAVARTMPADTAAFTGREPELEQLLAAAAAQPNEPGVIGIAAIGGMAGVGKTTFAVHAAHLLASRFPDGQLFVSLHAHTPGQEPADPEAVLAGLLLATGTPPQAIPAGMAEREAMWRDRMAGRRVLLVLDDVTGSSQIRPLLPAATGTLVLITSRHRLHDMPEAIPIALKELEPAQAKQLFIRLAARPEIRADDETVAGIVGQCGYLPLAIGVAAGQFKHHPVWTLSDLARYLAPSDDDVPAAGSGEVTASISLSYRSLPAGQQQLFRRLGLHPGTDIDVYAAAALNSTDLRVTRRILDEIYSYHLISEPVADRYRFHDLVASHARALAADEPPDERDMAVTRLLDYYVHTCHAAARQLNRRTTDLVAVAL